MNKPYKIFCYKDCCLTKAELAEIYETLEMTKSSKLVSVFDMLKQEEAEKKDQNQHISLLANGLDSILGGYNRIS